MLADPKPDQVEARTQADFQSARRQAFLRAILALIGRQPNQLLSFDQVREKLRIGGQLYRGVRPVPVSQIVGSVGRYRDFDRTFLPKLDESQYRWRSISRAFYEDVDLPPVQLYQIGEAYFVLDGNHRVSVARQRGQAFIDAEIIECQVRVPVTTELRPEDLDLMAERIDFLDRTRLDQLRPEQQIVVTEPGGYRRLLEHVAVHRYYMGLEWQRDIGEDEAVTHWYDTVYCPLVQVIREQDVLRHFSGRQEADLYLWVIDHQHALREQFGDDAVGPEQAASDYVEKFGSRGLADRVRESVTQVVGALGHRAQAANHPPPATEDKEE